MVAKVIGYTIGGMFIVLLLAPIGVSVYLWYDRITVLSTTEKAPATIVSCYHHYRTSGNRSVGSWGPLAQTSDGIEVKGSFRLSRKSWCEWFVGNDTHVLIDATSPDNSRIYSFVQFWFLPLLITLICLVFYPASYKLKKKKDREKKSAES